MPQITVWTERYREYSRHNSVNLIQAMNIKSGKAQNKISDKAPRTARTIVTVGFRQIRR